MVFRLVFRLVFPWSFLWSFFPFSSGRKVPARHTLHQEVAFLLMQSQHTTHSLLGRFVPPSPTHRTLTTGKCPSQFTNLPHDTIPARKYPRSHLPTNLSHHITTHESTSISRTPEPIFIPSSAMFHDTLIASLEGAAGELPHRCCTRRNEDFRLRSASDGGEWLEVLGHQSLAGRPPAVPRRFFFVFFWTAPEVSVVSSEGAKGRRGRGEVMKGTSSSRMCSSRCQAASRHVGL